MKLTSPAFADKIPVPIQYTCKGENVSPPLEFIDVPKEAKSLVLIVEDSDSADKRIHWLVYNIPGDCTHFNEGKSSKDAMQGICSDGVPGYQGPCPKQFKGIHRFSFRLLALDSMLPDNPLADSTEIQKRMNGHILDSAELVGVADGEQVSESVS